MQLSTFGKKFSLPVDPFCLRVLKLSDPNIKFVIEGRKLLCDESTIELVFVLGDVGWSDGLQTSKQVLDELSTPYIPVIGDNEVHYGDEQNFGTTFGPQYSLLSQQFSDWNMNGAAVWNPEEEELSWFTNFALSYKDLRLITLDWAARTEAPILSEMGDLHDFEGGTWSFFESEINSLTDQKENSVLLLSHIPMYLTPGGFDVAETERVVGLTNAYSELLYANFSGHFHLNAEVELEDGGFEVFVTDAIWDDEITIRMVEVWQNDHRVDYVQELIELEFIQ